MKRSTFLSRTTFFSLLILFILVGNVTPALATSANPALLAAPAYTVYTVQTGDTLSAIARRFGTTVAALKSLNGITNANQLAVGLRILAPSAVNETGLTATYTMRRGDTLNAIARRYQATSSVIQWLNGITNPNRIRVGQVIIVPALSGGGAGDSTTPITFPPGGTLATVNGNVTFPNRPCYILGAQAGQSMTVQITSPGNTANFLLKAADPTVNGGFPFKRLENEERLFAQLLPVTGDYIICVATPGGSTNFSLTVSIPPLSSGCSIPNSAIRTLDWNSLLTTESAFSHETIGGDHYISVIGSIPPVSGIPQVDQIVYADFDTDCYEEAAIPLFSGGTAGDIGYLVYRYGVPRPRLIGWGDGYKLGVSVSGNNLVVRNALYNGWEPNCCPSGFSYQTYTLVGDVLTLVSTTSEGLTEMQVETVRRFYELLQARDFVNGYALLASSFQVANPFAAWQAGYDNTVSFTFTVTSGAPGSNRVFVEIDATESLAGGGTRMRHYSGAWITAWDGSRPGWVLESGSFTVS